MSRLEINSFGSALCWPYQANNDKLLCFVLISYYLLGEYKTEKKNRRRWKSSRVSGAVFRIVRRATPAPLSVGPSTVPHTTIKHPRNPAKGVCYIYSVCLIVATAISTVTSQENKSERRRRWWWRVSTRNGLLTVVANILSNKYTERRHIQIPSYVLL